MKRKNIGNINKVFIIIGIKVYVMLLFFPLVFKKELSFKRFRMFYKRFSLYLKTYKKNKIFRKGNLLNIDLDMPRFGSSVFKDFCRKFLVFEEKLPCSNVLLSVTNECSFECKHCYQKEDKGSDVDIDILCRVTDEIINTGVQVITIEGGDPFLKYDRLEQLCGTIGDRAEILINSTGNGITLDRIEDLKSKCSVRMVMFSLNSPVEEDVNFFMGQDYAWNTLIHGSRLCSISSIDTGLNCCLQRDDYYNGNFNYLMEKAKDLGVSLVKLNLPKASGAWLKGGFQHFNEDDKKHISDLVDKYNKKSKYRSYPAVTAQLLDEDENNHGCTAGGTNRFYINSMGDVQPCQFLNISFGNIANESFSEIYSRMRKEFLKPGTAWLCDKSSQVIHDLFEGEGALPLNPEKSEEVVSSWDLGRETPLYKKLEKELV